MAKSLEDREGSLFLLSGSVIVIQDCLSSILLCFLSWLGYLLGLQRK